MRPVVLFGAFDRHNVGDLLFPHIAAALLPGHDLVYAGLARRDLRSCGGHRVQALAALAAAWGDRPAALLHVGGEILSCDAWQAAVMLLPPAQAPATIAYFADRPQARTAWARRVLGLPGCAPYTASREQLPGAAPVIHAGVGGVGLGDAKPALRAEVLTKLRAADHVSVRDRLTQAQLAGAGIEAALIPDPAVLVAELFGARIWQRAAAGEVDAVRRGFPQGHLAVQFSAEFGDDATLAQLAAQLNRFSLATGCGVALFRAGAAPWHDDLGGLQRLAARLRPCAVRVLHSLDLWDVCALIASSRAYCGSSLHGRIVAMAFARPRLNLQSPGSAAHPDKVLAFAQAWDDPGQPTVVAVDRVDDALQQALAADPAVLARKAAQLAGAYRQGFGPIRRALARAADR